MPWTLLSTMKLLSLSTNWSLERLEDTLGAVSKCSFLLVAKIFGRMPVLYHLFLGSNKFLWQVQLGSSIQDGRVPVQNNLLFANFEGQDCLRQQFDTWSPGCINWCFRSNVGAAMSTKFLALTFLQ